MRVKKIFTLVVALVILTCSAQAIEEELFFRPIEIKDGSSINIMDCVSAAFKNSPKIKRQKYNLDIAKSKVGIAKSQYFPVLSAGAGFYNENNSDNIYYNSHYREIPNVGVSINKLIWNFGKTTAFIKMEEFYKIAAEYEFMDSLCATLFDVKAKYYNVLKEQAMGRVWQENIKINERFLKLAKKEPDISSAKVYLSQSKVKMLDAQNGLKNAIVDLNNSMYLDGHPDYKLQNTPTFNLSANFTDKISNDAFKTQDFNFSQDKAIEIAYESSPDLHVLEATKSAMEQSLKYVKRTYFPDLTAGAGYGYRNTNQTSNNSFTVGVNLVSNVNLMELKHSIKGADAELKFADNEIELFKRDLYYEVKRAFNNIDKTERQIPIAKMSADEAAENLKLVESKYKSGVVTYTALQDARKDYIDEMLKYVECVYNYNLALIQAEMAMHYHIVDIHEKSEHAVHYHSDDLIKHLTEALDCDKHEEKHNKL